MEFTNFCCNKVLFSLKFLFLICVRPFAALQKKFQVISEYKIQFKQVSLGLLTVVWIVPIAKAITECGVAQSGLYPKQSEL